MSAGGPPTFVEAARLGPRSLSRSFKVRWRSVEIPDLMSRVNILQITASELKQVRLMTSKIGVLLHSHW